MMGAVRSWLLALIAVSLVCALADALMPKGAVRRVGKLVCGLALTLAILAPLARLDLDGGGRWLEDYLTGLAQREAELEQAVDSQMKIIIEQDYAAYIVDKAAQLGAVCSAQVDCREEDGLYLPDRVEIGGALPPKLRTGLVQALIQDLGVSEEQIKFGEEEVP